MKERTLGIKLNFKSAHRTLENVLADFKSVLTELDALIADGISKRIENAKQIAAIHEENQKIDAEVSKAGKVRANIEKLIEE